MNPAGDHYQADAFYRSVYRRLVGMMLVLAAAVMPVLWIRYRASLALSFLAGSVVAILNFHWLKRTIEAMGEQIVATGAGPSRSSAVGRFMLRYFLIALVAYVILKSSANSLYGLFAGLSLPVAAILIEAAYQLYRALRAEL
ncbi:MAG TPA: ATP synthase subunit I [Terriglobales bacterium]|nr:ATP synthase subunit I [Terriglobales bacterium]